MTSRFVLGTVQLGMPYGVANRTGKPDQRCADGIVSAAWKSGITAFDTAAAYGDSERVLGFSLRAAGAESPEIITKLPPHTLPCSASLLSGIVAASLERLRVSHLRCLMLHREEELEYLDGETGRVLQQMMHDGILGGIGVSVYTTDAAHKALAHPMITALQLPASVFDRRFELAGIFERAGAAGKTVYIRSALLQGVLCLAPDELPEHLRCLAPYLHEFQQCCRRFGLTQAQAALLFVYYRYPSAFILFGAETVGQVEENAVSLLSACSRESFLEALTAIMPEQNPEVLNPACWKKRTSNVALQ
ncbi:aldo/keto reductase [Oleidesulfovibrio alaskensis]|jgi:aryl-alcohol dehydrogenase-like predicted oxidoreductase|uniref:aldo/keto reductase n=1 Tax=Oleidesulfovibrio alaskensis TaxID=58180 RepID=UPI000485F7E0|nr:aldo/keto reductase [Oleidesulfovibrio alaskensis]